MLVCLGNGHVFCEDEVRKEKEDYGEETSCCPICGDDYLIEAEKCGWCGEWITDDFYELPDGEKICNYCYSEITPCLFWEL